MFRTTRNPSRWSRTSSRRKSRVRLTSQLEIVGQIFPPISLDRYLEVQEGEAVPEEEEDPEEGEVPEVEEELLEDPQLENNRVNKQSRYYPLNLHSFK